MPEEDHSSREVRPAARPGERAASAGSINPVETITDGDSAIAGASPGLLPSRQPVAKANSPAKAAAAKPAAPAAPPPQPFKARPSMPLSMINAPSASDGMSGSPEGDTDDELDRSIAAFKAFASRPPSLAVRLLRGFLRQGRDRSGDEDRHVAFDGYRSQQHDAKLERDRRYGSVYTVAESDNAYLVRLELPRRMPSTSLKRIWHLDSARPAYDYTVQLKHNVLAIQARLRGEALRRLAYVSPSYPTGFLTRIELTWPAVRFKHRLRKQTIEVIVFKALP